MTEPRQRRARQLARPGGSKAATALGGARRRNGCPANAEADRPQGEPRCRARVLLPFLAAALLLAGCGQGVQVQAKGQSVTSISTGSR
ncbi:hypothetical protein [Desulfovibrio legallii]|uniref:Uncharacterized protein n=1 Tax=Desulfovibrio legallii TaxID=571438 RepID=A0A1G7QUK4_9BACT|nr:hypothetical protein [Desulfovibrio legallii]SDG02211.1 hypothetical protein SAMN05192586_12416 [Desulfovibrio legallii]